MKQVNIIEKNALNKIKVITIYLGNTCNFDCVYCDRGYIESLGGQNLSNTSLTHLENFFSWVNSQYNEIINVTFHGGEPLLFIKRMDEIMAWLYPMAQKNNWTVTITTNGSLVKECEWFFEKYSDVLNTTVSYDFMHQKENREEFNVYEMADVLNRTCQYWQWQFVLPIEDPEVFSFDNIKEIVNTCYKTKCRNINLIPLRHKRGKHKFDVIIDRLPLPQFFDAFLQFIQILYIKKISIAIDGCFNTIDKAYFAEHYKLILSPDGFIYPEFDFLEYKIENARIGNWKNKQIWKNQGDNGRIKESCASCAQSPTCGLKYLYHYFDEEPKGSCKEFYPYMDFAIFHNAKLKENRNLFESIGIKEDFSVNI